MSPTTMSSDPVEEVVANGSDAERQAADERERDVSTRALAVNPYLRIVPCNKDEFLIKHGTRSTFSEVLRDERRTGLLGRLLGNLGSPASVEQLLDQRVVTGEELEVATQLAKTLLERGILVDPTQTVAQTYLSTLFDSSTAAASPLATTTLGLVGCGQLGSKIADEFRRLGSVRFALFDPRPVSPADAAYLDVRSDGARDASLRGRVNGHGNGHPEAEVVAAARPDLADDDALAEVCERSSFVVLAMETYSPTVLHALNEAAIAHRTPWISVFFDGSEAVIGPTYIPGETCCYHEFETQSQASLRYKAEHLVFKEFLRDSAADTEPLVLPPYASIAAGFAATSVLHSLLRQSTFTSGRAMRINFQTLSIDMQDVLRLPRCPACGGARPTYRNLFL